MHSRNYNSWNSNSSCNTCQVCKQPEPTCGCPTNKPKWVDLKIKEFNCKNPSYFEMGECAAFKVEDCNGGYFEYYKSNRNANNIPPNHPPTDPNDPYWLGPFDICDIFENSGAQGPQGQIGAQGSMGETGRDGAQGSIGLTGVQGPVGVQGVAGNTGVQGQIGAQGLQGIQGEIGETGAQGVVGAQGQIGSQGITGNTGSQGSIGQTGSQGIEGVQGAVGQTGNQGSQGQVGSQGAQGIEGAPYNPTKVDSIDNYTCVDGQDDLVLDLTTGQVWSCVNGQLISQGEYTVGPQGTTGSQGEVGSQGSQGVAGSQGVIGQTGAQGLVGQTGSQGVPGVQGAVGSQGPQGIEGQQGATGSQGNVGSQGSQGVAGPQGQKGAQGATGVGAQGANGVQGVTGAQGSQGVAGPQGQKGVQGVQGPSGGPQGAEGSQGPQGSQGPEGKPYDPNCNAPLVTEILCPNPNPNAPNYGKITLVFEEVDGIVATELMSVDSFKPTNQDIASAEPFVDGNGTTLWRTSNQHDSVITWFNKPTIGMSFILNDFKAGGKTDHDKQLITFDVIDSNSACLGYGSWELLVECPCPCNIPEMNVKKDISGKECAVWDDHKGNIIKLALCDSNSCGTEDKYQGCTPLLASDWEECNGGVPMGYYIYNGAYYLNRITDNQDRPDSLDGWDGPFNTFELIDRHFEWKFNSHHKGV